MLEDLKDRYISNVQQNVKELLLIASIVEPREGFKYLAFLSEPRRPLTVCSRHRGKRSARKHSRGLLISIIPPSRNRPLPQNLVYQ
jgi:hypothetical protein